MKVITTNRAVLLGGMLLVSLAFFGSSLARVSEWQDSDKRSYEVPRSQAEALLSRVDPAKMKYDPTKKYVIETSIVLVHYKTSPFTFATRLDTTGSLILARNISE